MINSFQGTFPGRYKGMHFYNGGKFMDFFIGLFKTFAPKKYAERVRYDYSVMHTSENLFQAI